MLRISPRLLILSYLRHIRFFEPSFSGGGRALRITLSIRKYFFSACPVAVGFCPPDERRQPRAGFRKEKLMMDKIQISQRTLSGVLSTSLRWLFWACFFLLALFLALSLTSLQPIASAQSCFDQCQQEYVQCLNSSTEDPVMDAICDDRYDACFGNCL